MTDMSRFERKNMTDFMCGDVSNVEFLGTQSDDLNKYFHFEILQCEEELLHEIPGYETASCASPQEIKMFFAMHLITGLLTNSFIDSADFDSPIKT